MKPLLPLTNFKNEMTNQSLGIRGFRKSESDGLSTTVVLHLRLDQKQLSFRKLFSVHLPLEFREIPHQTSIRRWRTYSGQAQLRTLSADLRSPTTDEKIPSLGLKNLLCFRFQNGFHHSDTMTVQFSGPFSEPEYACLTVIYDISTFEEPERNDTDSVDRSRFRILNGSRSGVDIDALSPHAMPPKDCDLPLHS